MKQKIRDRLQARSHSLIADDGFMPSAVIIPIYEASGLLHTLVTKRTDQVEHHKGHICFPGGARDPEDRDIIETALRECKEEMGILTSDVEVLGRLDDITTMTNFVITPFVGFIPHPYTFRPNPMEIKEVIEIPIERFMATCEPTMETIEWDGGMYPVYYFQFGRHNIWGATGKILKQFLEVVFDWRPFD